MRNRCLGVLVSAIVAVSILGGADPPAAFQQDARDGAAEPESICAAALTDACALAATERAHRLRTPGLAASASPSQPVRIAPAPRAFDDGGARPSGHPLARWCLAHSTSTSLV